MKSAVTTVSLAAVLALSAVSGCVKREPVLRVYNWVDYIKPELVQQFEAENKCRVVIDTYESNEEMYDNLRSGAGGYDLMFPTSYMAALMQSEGMLQPIQQNLVPNLAHLDPDYLKIAPDREMKHSVPYMLTNTGIACLKSKVPDAEHSWNIFGRSDLAGRMTMLDDMRETIGGALKSLGFSINTTNERELAAARDVVIGWKKNLAKFENEQYETGLTSGEFLVVHGYNGDLLQARDENPDIEFFVPQEGTVVSCDDMVIPKDAQNVDLAHKFINFLHDPKIAAENVGYVYFLCPNVSSYRYLDKDIVNDPAIFLPPDLREKSEVIHDLGADNAKYVKVWDEIKAAK